MTKFFINCYIAIAVLISGLASATNQPVWQTLAPSPSPFQKADVSQPTQKAAALLRLHYITPKQAADQLAPLSKAFGSGCSLHPQANPAALWCIGASHCCEQLRQPLRLIDKPSAQIRIRAKIIGIDRERARALGIAFKTIVSDRDGLSTVLPKVSTLEGSAVVSLARLGDNNLFAMEISALERSGQAKIIAQPTLITESNKAAIIESGEEVPYQQNTSSGATNIAFKKAVLRLSVTPQLQGHQRIHCAIDIHQDKVTPINVNGAPIIHTQHIQTHSLIRNRHTLVLGGIITNSSESSLQAVPGLSKLPLMGNLFKHQQRKSKQQELFIFITPELVK